MRNKTDKAVFMLTRYVRGAKISKNENIIKVTNYPELTSSAKVGFAEFVHDCPNLVKPTDTPTELRVV